MVEKGKVITTKLNHKYARMGEIPSGANHSSARGMAKMAAFMANKGTFEGKKLISEEIWEELHSETKVSEEWPHGTCTAFTKGGFSHHGLHVIENHKRFTGTDRLIPVEASQKMERHLHKHRADWYGWCGFGGSVM